MVSPARLARMVVTDAAVIIIIVEIAPTEIVGIAKATESVALAVIFVMQVTSVRRCVVPFGAVRGDICVADRIVSAAEPRRVAGHGWLIDEAYERTRTGSSPSSVCRQRTLLALRVGPWRGTKGQGRLFSVARQVPWRWARLSPRHRVRSLGFGLGTRLVLARHPPLRLRHGAIAADISLFVSVVVAVAIVPGASVASEIIGRVRDSRESRSALKAAVCATDDTARAICAPQSKGSLYALCRRSILLVILVVATTTIIIVIIVTVVIVCIRALPIGTHLASLLPYRPRTLTNIDSAVYYCAVAGPTRAPFQMHTAHIGTGGWSKGG